MELVAGLTKKTEPDDVPVPPFRKILPPEPPVEEPAVRLMALPFVETAFPTVTDIEPLKDDDEWPVAIDMAPELAVDELPVARLRSPLEDPALLPAASAVTKLAAPELALSLAPDVMDTIPPPVDVPEPPEIVTEPP